jgi:hypothetical protein
MLACSGALWGCHADGYNTLNHKGEIFLTRGDEGFVAQRAKVCRIEPMHAWRETFSLWMERAGQN